MYNTENRNKQTTRFLKWIQEHRGWWYLICTPEEEHMNLQMMKLLITRLYQEEFYEIIFVLLMVHRNDPIMSHTLEHLLLDGITARWNQDRKNIIQQLLTYFE